MNQVITLATLACLTASAASAQQTHVVPAAHTNAEAPAYGWIAGASRDVRQQTLIGSSHLTPLAGHVIHAMEFRRNAADEVYVGGTANVALSLSIAPTTPIDCSNVFAANVGSGAIQVFSGQVTLPTSPAPGGGIPDWSNNNVVRIDFTSPFPYAGGTLCVDLIGHAIPGQSADWWMADLDLEDISGVTSNLGGGCGIYGGAQSAWSNVSSRSLLPGAFARFSAYGTPFGLAIAAFGQRAPFGTPLAMLGFPAAAGCDLYLSSLDGLIPTIFVPPLDPTDLSFGGEAEVEFKVPSSASTFGFSMTTQWIDWTQMATSNAVEWTIASATPTLEMALVEGDPTSPTGLASVYMGHVLRFTYQ